MINSPVFTCKETGSKPHAKRPRMVMASMVFMNRVYQRRRTKQPMDRQEAKNSRTHGLNDSRMQERGDADVGARPLVLLEFLNS
jgi:hypothetical protein